MADRSSGDRGWVGWRRAAAVSGAVVTALLAVLLMPGMAWAGGPTSVLLVSPQTDRAAALYNTDPAYDRLLYLLGGEPAADPGPPPPEGGTYVTVTWLVHDVSIWRLDRVFLDPVSGPWVVTRTGEGGELSTDLGPGEDGGPGAAWHRPGDPAALTALLADLGLLSGARDPAVTAPVAAGQAGTAPAAPGGSGAAQDGVWWWAGAGAVLGASGALLGMRTSAGLRRRVLPVPDLRV